MDGRNFDDLTRALARGASRRGLLRGLAGALLGGLAGARVAAAAAQRAPRQPNGAPCARAAQCASFQCVAGVCCNTGCTGQCEGCATGTCQPVSGPPPPGKPACPGSGPCALACDGATRTSCAAAPAPGTACGATACAHGWLTIYTCGGNGSCVPTTTSCAPFGCAADGTSCATGCTSDTQCGAGSACVAGACVAARSLGEGCTAGGECASGVCAQGVCCASACAGACQSCNLPGNEGFCTEIADGGPCAGGTCCDGACVDTQTSLEHCGACDRACRLAPAPGSCEAAPICDRGTCAFTPQPTTFVCRPAAGVCDRDDFCDGVTLACPPDAFRPTGVPCRDATDVCDRPAFCTGASAACPTDRFAGPTVACRQARCVDGVATARATCTGASAACPDPVTEACTPYLCGATACLDSCAGPDNEGCVPSHHCDDGVCLPDEGLGAGCDEDSDCQNGVCAAGVCCNTACAGECRDCATGTCLPRTDQACGAAAICQAGDTLQAGGTCTAQGTCQAGGTVACAPYACAGGVCLTVCGDHFDCAAGFHCAAAVCVPDLGPGDSCSDDDACASGVCNPASHVCCNEACDAGVPCIGPSFSCDCPDGTSPVGDTCCVNANICGSSCLDAPCAAGQCLECNEAAGACQTTCPPPQSCVAGSCACAGGLTPLSNGTCARSCSTDGECQGAGPCQVCIDNASGSQSYCAGSLTQTICLSDDDCDVGLFCSSEVRTDGQNACVTANC